VFELGGGCRREKALRLFKTEKTEKNKQKRTEETEEDRHYSKQKRTGIIRLQVSVREGIMMVVLDVGSGRTSDDSGSKSTRGRERNSLLPLHFPLRAAGVLVRRWI
jgi:hypothetical protein